MKVNGPQTCPRPCVDCADGKHHWLPECIDLDNPTDDDREDYAQQIAAGVAVFAICRHCDAWTDDVDVALGLDS